MMKPTIDVPQNGQTWLICGGRDFANREMFEDAMAELIQSRGIPSRIINGGATGADLMARKWAEGHALDLRTVAANWGVHGKAAGMIRNQGMLTWYLPDLVVAFPGGRSTADMMHRSKVAGVDVAEIKVGR